MNELRKAAEMALEALGYPEDLDYDADRVLGKAADKLRAALEQPQVEQEQGRQIDQLIRERDHRDEIIDKLCDAVLGPDRYEWSSQYFFEDAVREVEERMAALEQPAQQEPVADVRAYAYSGAAKNGEFFEAVLREGAKVADGDKLYTSPQPSKPWVGLTRDERMDIINRFAGQDWVYAVEAIETKLREKNT